MSGFKHGSKPVIGLIGAIGAGKSTAALCFAARGAYVIDADALGHEALRQRDIADALVQRWGKSILKPDGTLNRREISSIVFSSESERNYLEATVFPYIGQRTLGEIAAAQVNPERRFIVLDAAVLVEAGWRDMVDRIIYIDAPRDLRIARLSARSGWSESELAAREAAQRSASEKQAIADAIIENTGDQRRLQLSVDQLLKQWHLVK